MNEDELKKMWQQQPLRSPDLSPEQLISAMESKTTQLRFDLLARDTRELFACVVLILVFGFYFLRERTPVVRIGWLVVVGSMVFVAWKLVYARRSTPPAPPGASIVESLRAELRSVRAQSDLLGSVLWWYLLPPTIGVLIATWGMRIHTGVKIGCSLMFIAIDAFIYWLNRWARSKQLVPLETQLQSLLHSAETGEPLDETHVTQLRPIGLSMAAAAQAKPAEFKVAFWQIALYGETAFIAAWFFLMLGQTEGKFALIFNWQHVVWLVPTILGGFLFCWVLQTTTERAVGISTLGIHLYRGQSLILWSEITEVRTLAVLNIRSLWLIRESGEKTLMPWNSLERHSELKAAVESFAPANHPIRKYLALLTRN
jgi:hypothetical protein